MYVCYESESNSMSRSYKIKDSTPEKMESFLVLRYCFYSNCSLNNLA